MPSLSPENRSRLLSRLRADQSERWRRGEKVGVEHYLGRHPDLADSPDVLLDLIFAEALLRDELGDTPTLDEYVARFPIQSGLLKAVLATEALIGSWASFDTPGSGDWVTPL